MQQPQSTSAQIRGSEGRLPATMSLLLSGIEIKKELEAN
jgi:hypothetical protein